MPRPNLNHVDLVVSSLERSLPFYRDLLAPLGWTELGEARGERGEAIWCFGGPGGTSGFDLREAQSDATPLPYDRYAVGVHHVAFDAPSREVVDERHRWLVAAGAEIESPPREHDYTPGYYAVFFYDPDGIKVEVVHQPPRD